VKHIAQSSERSHRDHDPRKLKPDEVFRCGIQEISFGGIERYCPGRVVADKNDSVTPETRHATMLRMRSDIGRMIVQRTQRVTDLNRSPRRVRMQLAQRKALGCR